MKVAVIILALLPVFSLGEIELYVSPEESQPGDLVELRASITSTEYIQFELMLPEHPALYLVAHQRQPVVYHDGFYRQNDIWVLQSKQPGTIELEGIKAVIQQGGETRETLLPSVSLNVIPYAIQDDDFTPQALPDKVNASDASNNVLGLIILLVAGTCAALAFILLPRKEVAIDAVKAKTTLEDLQSAILKGEESKPLMESVLCDNSLVLADDLKGELERVIYLPSADTETLRRLLEREVHS